MACSKQLNSLCSLCRDLFHGQWVSQEEERLRSMVRGLDNSSGGSVSVIIKPDINITQEQSFLTEQLRAENDEEKLSNGNTLSSQATLQEHVVDSEDKDELNENHFYELPDWVKVDSSGRTYSPRHHNYFELQKSAKLGCHLCTILWSLAKWKVTRLTSEHNNIQAVLYQARGIAIIRPDTRENTAHNHILGVSYFRGTRYKLSSSYLFGIEIGLISVKTSSHLPQQPQDLTSSISKTTFKALKNWIDDCLSRHPYCWMRKTNPIVLPTRLLDLGDWQEPIRISLCETETLSCITPYMTLSHRWAERDTVSRLLKSNYGSFTNSIPLSIIPRTFRDAITFTRSMMIRYLWIDALCIIQDSEDDWIHEVGKMQSVYSNSYLNIAATNTLSPFGGLFYKRNILEAASCFIDTSWTGHESGQYYTLSDTDWARYVDHGKLNTRGWVFQERLLATRIVHFAKDKLYWNCIAQIAASEVYPDGIPHHVNFESWPLRGTNIFLTWNNLEDVEGEEHHSFHVSMWLSIVQDYTRTNLTFERDKLFALSGFAKLFKTKMEVDSQEYLAGLWRYDLHVSLLWRMLDTGRRYKTYVAPTWSWASVEGQVYFDLNEATAKYHVRVVEAKVECKNGDYFGYVIGGHVTLRGSLCRIKLSEQNLSTPDSPIFEKLHMNGFVLRGENEFTIALDDEEGLKMSDAVSLHFLPFRTYNLGTEVKQEYSIEGLILSRIVGVDHGQYLRIGWMRIFTTQTIENIIKNRADDFLGDMEYISNEGGYEYTVRIY